MSKGPGRVQRSILALIKEHPGEAFTVEDVSRAIYQTNLKPTRAQLVAVDRALKSVKLPSRWKVGYIQGHRRPWLFNERNLASVSRRAHRLQTFVLSYQGDLADMSTTIELNERKPPEPEPVD
jgi:hypothetical protein